MDTNWDELLKLAEDQKLILEIGANKKPQAQYIDEWKNSKFLTLDIDANQHPDIQGDAADMPPELYGQLDGLLASHVLEHFSYHKTDAVLEGWIRCLKEGGELHVLVPSWEWAAREVLSENPSPALYGHSFAGQVNEWDEHLCMFTMRRLRSLFEKHGLSVFTAKTGVYHIRTPKGEFPAHQHYIAGVKGEPRLSKGVLREQETSGLQGRAGEDSPQTGH